MWSVFTARPLDYLSGRHISLFLLAIFMAVFAATSVYTAQVAAQTPPVIEAEAKWNGDNLLYVGLHDLTKTPASDPTVPPLEGTVCANKQNIYRSGVLENVDSEPDLAVIYVMCLKDDTSINDKSKPINAQLIVFRGEPGARSVSRDFPRRSVPTDITIAPLATDPASSGENSTTTTSCDSTYTHGLGWFICPLTNFLADGMDWLYEEVLTKFLIVRPVSTDQDSALFRAWGFMRNLANVLFVIGFLIIIYSQITTLGLSNYGIKRLLPRLVVAAILVNISYWLSAIAIDISNIMGGALQDMFYAMRNGLVVEGQGNSYEIPKWSETATYILSGGAILGGLGGILLAVGAGTVGAAVLGLVPILMVAIMSALVAVLVMAARQAIITILVILSPLACVAFLLPNTEKYFDRWRDLFITMLMVFPLFSVVFGGSQLAAAAIIQNADGIMTVILGLAVQVAPLALTPLLIKLSGSLIGRIAGMVNNPNRGLIDRTRKFTDERAQLRRAEAMARNTEIGPNGQGYRRNNLGARLARNLEKGKRSRAGFQKAHEQNVDAWFANTNEAHMAHDMAGVANLRKEKGEKEAEALFDRRVRSNDGTRRLYFEAKSSHDDANLEKKINEGMYASVKANPDLAPGDIATDGLARHIRDTAYRERNMDSNLSISQERFVSNHNQALTADQRTGSTPEEAATARAMRDIAGNIVVDDEGPSRVFNIAQEAETQAREKRVGAAVKNLDREEATVDEEYNLVLARPSGTGRFEGFDTNIDNRSAAIRRFAETAPQVRRIEAMQEMDLSRNATGDDAVARSEFVGNVIAKHKPVFVPAPILQAMAEGTLDPVYNSVSGTHLMIEDFLNAKGLGVQTALQADRDDLKEINKYFLVNGTANLTDSAQDVLINNLNTIFTDTRYSGQLAKNRNEINDLRQRMGLHRIEE